MLSARTARARVSDTRAIQMLENLETDRKNIADRLAEYRIVGERYVFEGGSPWNTENWGKLVRRFRHSDWGAWACPLPMGQRMKRNRFKFCTDFWSWAATFWIRLKFMARTRTRNFSDVSCARFLAIASSWPPNLAF